MTDPFIGEIRMNAFKFAPKGWASCDGQTLDIQQNAALFSLVGRYYGTNGTTTFNLPDLRGRAVVGYQTNTSMGGLTGQTLGAQKGVESVALTVAQVPSHTHDWQVTDTQGDSPLAKGNFYAQAPSGVSIYANPMNNIVALHPKIMNEAGGGKAHNNMQPSLPVNFCISLVGYYPPRQ